MFRTLMSVVATNLLVFSAADAIAQTQPAPAAAAPVTTLAGVELPADYVIGPEDVLGVVFWREQDMSGDVTVRPDGKITLPLLGDVVAAGLSPTELKEKLQQNAAKFLTEPNATVVVREINSRQVFITGMVAKPGAYPLSGPRTVMQLIAIAGGLLEYAAQNDITIIRMENGQQRSFRFRYEDVSRGKGLPQNILLKPGDSVVVP